VLKAELAGTDSVSITSCKHAWKARQRSHKGEQGLDWHGSSYFSVLLMWADQDSVASSTNKHCFIPVAASEHHLAQEAPFIVKCNDTMAYISGNQQAQFTPPGAQAFTASLLVKRADHHPLWHTTGQHPQSISTAFLKADATNVLQVSRPLWPEALKAKVRAPAQPLDKLSTLSGASADHHANYGQQAVPLLRPAVRYSVQQPEQHGAQLRKVC
jgi:hypothetical protein